MTYPENSQSAQDAARQQADQVSDRAQDAAQQMAGSAREEVGQVKDEALHQFRSLTDSTKEEAFSQAATQQERLAKQSRSVTDDLQRLARGERPESDLVNQALTEVATRAQQITRSLETKEPRDLLEDARRFAARRPGTFLAISAGVGVALGRVTRGLTDNDDTTRSATAPARPSPAQPMPAPPEPTLETPSGYGADPLGDPYTDPYSDPLTGETPGDLPGGGITGPTTPGVRP